MQALADGFYLDGRASFHYSPIAPSLKDLKADDLHRVLRENQVTHLVVGQPNQWAGALSSRESEFTRRYLRKQYQRNAQIDLSEYGRQRTRIVFKTKDPSGCSDYFRADPVFIARTSDSPSSVAKSGSEADPHFVVSGGSIVPAKVRVGESFGLEFFGSA